MNMISNVGKVDKGWGHETIFASEQEYCGKFLSFNSGAMFSMHFHRNKKETWYCLSGEFMIDIIDTNDASKSTHRFNPGDTWTNERLSPHQVICIEGGTIIEVSSADDPKDNYRVIPGDSQK